jgi:hypothetical protein
MGLKDGLADLLREMERIEKLMSQPLEGLPVLPTAERVVIQSRWVGRHPERLEAAVRQWGEHCPVQNTWDHPCHCFDGTAETVRWIFVLDVLNHCFWPDVGQATWTVTVEGREYSGYWALAASLKRAVGKGFRITDPEYLAELKRADLSQIFSGQGEIPLLEDRLVNLREAGRIILSHWQGDILHLLEETRGSAVETVRQVVASFPSFQDEVHYAGRKVFFWKRAQLLVADIHAAFGGKGWGEFNDFSALTAFADYKLPQVLRELGILSYEEELAGKVDLRECLAAGSDQEIEIRAMTIHAVEDLKKAFCRRGTVVTSAQVDQWLWQLGQIEAFRRRPYHRCRTIFY